MKAICRDRHFLAKEYREETTGRALSFSLSEKERAEIGSGNFASIGSQYSLKCHMGVWDEGVCLGQDRRVVLVEEKRADRCFFFPLSPGMLFRAAETLQRQAVENRELKRAHYFAVTGLLIAGIGLGVSSIFEVLNYFK